MKDGEFSAHKNPTLRVKIYCCVGKQHLLFEKNCLFIEAFCSV
jgi:hypothetical protein